MSAARACIHAMLTLALLAVASAHALPPVQVGVEGAVRSPGPQTLPAGSRLVDAVVAAMPDAMAYPTAAALYRQQAIVEQTRLKAGLAHDLQVLQTSDNAALRDTARALADWLIAQPVTGRVRTQLELRRLEVDAAANLPLADGDRIVYPRRPVSIRVVGAVARPCVLPHVALQDARDYLRDCPTPAADRDWLYVIQPDGAVERIGIAAWNRAMPHSLAPGAVLYAPLPVRALRDVDPSFNAEFASFIATQAIDASDMRAPDAVP